MLRHDPPRSDLETNPKSTIRRVGKAVFDHLPIGATARAELKRQIRIGLGGILAMLGQHQMPHWDKESGVPTLDFRCNICGSDVKNCPVSAIDREIPSCPGCRSSVRMRSIIHLLSMALFGKSLAIKDWPVDKTIKGIGLSDWDGYADRLPAKVDYINTYFHKRPHLDICNPPEDYINAFDFLISTEVFEHVPPPPQRAFDAAFKILKPNGVLVFTVPFSNEPGTEEHFPNLNRYEVVEIDDDYVLVNRQKDGEYELHESLAFHSGPGETLEMRVYSRTALMQHLKEAGFDDIRVMDEPFLELAIIHKLPWSFPILARKPA